MLIFILGLFLAIIFSFALWVIAIRLYNDDHDGISLMLQIINVIFGIVIIIMLIMIPFYYSAKITVKIINQKYHTEYTADQYFWSGSTIDKILKTDENLLDSNNKLNLEIKK